MKIKKAHLEILKTGIEHVLDQNPDITDEYEKGIFPRSEKVKDLQRRFCFDLLYAAGLTVYVSRNIYPYANDTHVYTALKTLCPKITRQY